MENALLVHEKSRNENNQPIFCFISLIFFNTRLFFSWQVGGVWVEWGELSPEEKSGTKARNAFSF